MSGQLSKREKAARIKTVFKSYDINGDGTISCEELQTVLKSLGHFKEHEISAVFKHIDKNRDGKLQFDEFVDWLTASTGQHARARSALAPGTNADDDLNSVFLSFCGAGQSEMDSRSFTKLCRDCNFFDEQCPATEADIIFAKVVPKGKRRIGLDKFEAALQLLAQKKGVRPDDIRDDVLAASPALRGTKADDVRFHDDKSTYTGTHRAPGPSLGGPSLGVPPSLEAAGGPAGGVKRRVKSRETSTSPRPPSAPREPRGPQYRTMEEIFRLYSGAYRGVDMMEGKSFVKLCKDCQLFDAGYTAVEADVLFATISGRSRRISKDQFFEAAMKIAEKKGVDLEVVTEAIRTGPGPELRGTPTEHVRFHDDRAAGGAGSPGPAERPRRNSLPGAADPAERPQRRSLGR